MCFEVFIITKKKFSFYNLIINNFKNGLIAAIPYIACWLFINIATIISDKLLEKNKISKLNLRRICTAIGTLAPGFFIVGLSFINCNHVILGVVLLTLGVGFEYLKI